MFRSPFALTAKFELDLCFSTRLALLGSSRTGSSDRARRLSMEHTLVVSIDGHKRHNRYEHSNFYAFKPIVVRVLGLILPCTGMKSVHSNSANWYIAAPDSVTIPSMD